MGVLMATEVWFTSHSAFKQHCETNYQQLYEHIQIHFRCNLQIFVFM